MVCMIGMLTGKIIQVQQSKILIIVLFLQFIIKDGYYLEFLDGIKKILRVHMN